MKSIYFFLSLLLANALVAQAQDCTNCRYISPLFDSVEITRDVLFGEGVNEAGDLQQLYMDVYEPFGDTETQRPVMIFAFGGGFVQGSRTDWYVEEVCRHFAKLGYVAVANDYRYGINIGEVLSGQHMRIFFRPMQDMRATVQYLKADFAELGNNFNIDTSKIIVGGASAGAITALMHHHCDKESEISEMGDISALDALGGFHSTTGFYPNYDWRGVATVNVAGALINADWIEAGDPPHIAAHGDADAVVPYGDGPFLSDLLQGIFDLQGSYKVDSIANARNVCSYLFTMEGHDHPSESMGIPYLKSVLYRMAQRCQAVIEGKNFCCDLSVDIGPNDTLYFESGSGLVELNSTIANDNGNADLQWCSIICGFDGTGSTLNIEPSSGYVHVALTATEGNCQASDLYMLMQTDSPTTSIVSQYDLPEISVFPTPASNSLKVRMEDQYKENLATHFYLLDSAGKLALRIEAQLQTTIDVSRFSPGNYLLLAVEDEHVIGAKKVSITR